MLENIKDAMFECNEELCKEYSVPYIHDELYDGKSRIVIDCTYSNNINVQSILDYTFDTIIAPTLFEYWPRYKEYEISEGDKVFWFTLEGVWILSFATCYTVSQAVLINIFEGYSRLWRTQRT